MSGRNKRNRKQRRRTPWHPDPRAEQRVRDALPAPTHCRFCAAEFRIMHHDTVYGRAYGDWPWCYACTACDARVGLHPGTAIPLGTLADGATRAARRRAKAPFQAYVAQCGGKRHKAYAELARRMHIPVRECHFGWFSEAQCGQAETILRVMLDGSSVPR